MPAVSGDLQPPLSPSAPVDHAGGDEGADEQNLNQRQDTESSGQQEQQNGQEKSRAEILDQIPPSQPIVPRATAAVGSRRPYRPRWPRGWIGVGR
jgi:hypothetical protein